MIMTGTIRPFLCVAALLLLVPGCVSLGRDSPPLELYVIGSDASASATPVPGLDGVTVGVRRLHLAPYLATAAIVVRRGPHEILTSDYHRWGEDLAEGINRALARQVGGRAQFRTVDVAPWPVRSRYDYLVQFHVERFEGVVAPGPPVDGAVGAVHVLASWEIIRQQDETVLARGSSEFREEGWRVGDYAALVALLDRGLVLLAHDLTAALGGVVAARGSQDSGG
jgi:uncharacterized protein